MLNYTLEFLRIADPQPADEKIRKRRDAASDVVNQLVKDGHHNLVLMFVQGIVGGFQGPLFTADSAAVTFLVNAIKVHASLPNDLTENCLELRAVAGIVIGELLTTHGKTPEAVLAGLAIRTALSSKPVATEKHVRWMLETLLSNADKVVDAESKLRRHRGTPALDELSELEKPEEEAEAWEALSSAVQAAITEAHDLEKINREEIETLWWLFTAHSVIEHKALSEIASPLIAAFCSGIELAQRAILPPPLSAVELVKRAVESGRKPATLTAVSLQDAAATWVSSDALIKALCRGDTVTDSVIHDHPALFPISWVCRQMREAKDASKLGKEVNANTGLPLTHKHTPSDWGAQVYREAILMRAVLAHKEQ